MHVLHGVVCHVVVYVCFTLCVYAHGSGEGTGCLSGVATDPECYGIKMKVQAKY